LALFFVYFCRAMLCKRGLCRYAVCVCFVCVSVTFVQSVKTNKDIFEIFSPSGSHTILVFRTERDGDIPTAGTRLTGTSTAGWVGRNRDSEPMSGITAATGQVLSTWRAVDHGHRPASYDTYIAGRVFDHQAPRSMTSHRHRGSTARDRPSALSHYTQSRSTANRVYDSKARRYAEDNRTESNCTHW